MDSSSTRRIPPRFFAWAAALLFLGYAVFLYVHLEAWAGGSDSSGYMNQARFLSEGKIHVPQRVPAGVDARQFDWFTFIPLGFQPEPATSSMVPSYPLGLPLILIGVAQIVGWEAAPWVTMLLSALLGVALMIPLGRVAGLPTAWAWFGAFLLAASPLYTAMSVQLFTDVPATTAAVATVLAAWRSRAQPLWAGAAGAFLALAVLIRPSNIVLIAPVAVALGLDWRRWLWLGAGGLPGALFQCGYNLRAYGGAFKSGYGDLGPLFSSAFVFPTLLHYAKWLPVLLTPIGLLVLALPWLRKNAPFARVVILWVAVVLGFYVGYRHTSEEWWYLRFVLPAFPAAIVGGLAVAHTAWSRRASRSNVSPRRSLLIAALLVGVVLGQSAAWHRYLRATRTGSGESMYHGAVAWARAHLPASTVLMAMQCTGAVAYHSDFQIVRWDLLDPARFRLLAKACTQSGQPIHAMLFQHEEAAALRLHLPGTWRELHRERLISFWEWRPGP